MSASYLAVDLGAESGRVVLGRFDGGRVSLEEVHRFPNVPVLLPDGLHWDALRILTESAEVAAYTRWPAFSGRLALTGCGGS